MKDTNSDLQITIPEVLPLLPLKDVVVYPFMIVPLFVNREASQAAVDHALANDRLVFMVAQKDAAEENPKAQDLYEIGSVGMIIRMRKLSDGRMKILVQGLLKGRLNEWLSGNGSHDPMKVNVDVIREDEDVKWPVEIEALMRSVKDNMEKLISMGKNLSPDILLVIGSVTDPGRLADLVAANLMLKVEESQGILEQLNPVERLTYVNDILSREIEVLQMQAQIETKAREEMSKTQREYYLREQLRQIKGELGEAESQLEEIEHLRHRIMEAKMPESGEEEALKQLRRLENMSPESAEAAVVRTYIEWLADLPWSVASDDVIDVIEAKRILDEDHYDLEDVKERILEFLGVRKLKADHRGPILCFVGPPGVGKTSLGKSIGRALGRKFVRISLGGVRDEAEIRGHRRTYVGALPGKIIQSLKQAGTRNPVFMLDEIDKLGSDFRGDPSSALLETLDPEQNNSFVDHYINIPFNLRDVMFIATANVLDTIPPALLDRMEVIHLAGYSMEQKIAIAKQYILGKQMEENGVTDEHIHITEGALKRVISEYTREAGLRNLERRIAALCRKVALKVAKGHDRQIVIKAGDVPRYLGPPVFLKNQTYQEDMVGVSAGLAWTATGGELLYIEMTKMKGKGALQLTGKLGDVMKESAMAALSYIRTVAGAWGISFEVFEQYDIHIHVPAGAVPKDGPSAGITIGVALVSLLTGRAVRHDVAMTGEITLTGRVLPIGGLREKLLAALRHGMSTIIIPAQNEAELAEVPKPILRKLQVVLAHKLEDALEVALIPSNDNGSDVSADE